MGGLLRYREIIINTANLWRGGYVFDHCKQVPGDHLITSGDRASARCGCVAKTILSAKPNQRCAPK